eukprot:13776963-Heterocapsa_arctica.AAC.1
MPHPEVLQGLGVTDAPPASRCRGAISSFHPCNDLEGVKGNTLGWWSGKVEEERKLARAQAPQGPGETGRRVGVTLWPTRANVWLRGNTSQLRPNIIYHYPP